MEKTELDKKYNEWLKTEDLSGGPDKDKTTKLLIDEMSFLSSLNVEEYTLFRKWQEIKEKYPNYRAKAFSAFFDEDRNIYPEIASVKNNIWIPDSPDDYLKLEPEVIIHNPENVNQWNTLRVFLSTMLNNSNIGRNIYASVNDRKTSKILGIIGVSSDFMDLTCRDDYIGWSRDIKTSQKMINHTAIGSTIVPTQPLGYSYVGGKLLALLTLCKPIEDYWDKRYGSKLAGITTTSLYGSFSQYNNLKYWTKRGHSAGSVKFEPRINIRRIILDWLRCNYPRKYFEWYIATNPAGMPLKRDHRQRSFAFIFKELKIPKEFTESDHQRGVYFCPLFNNTCEFLRKEIMEDKLVRRFDNSVESLVKIWKENYACKRVKSLLEQNRYSKDTLFYDDMIMMDTWEEVKDKYLKDVGR